MKKQTLTFIKALVITTKEELAQAEAILDLLKMDKAPDKENLEAQEHLSAMIQDYKKALNPRGKIDTLYRYIEAYDLDNTKADIFLNSVFSQYHQEAR